MIFLEPAGSGPGGALAGLFSALENGVLAQGVVLAGFSRPTIWDGLALATWAFRANFLRIS